MTYADRTQINVERITCRYGTSLNLNWVAVTSRPIGRQVGRYQQTIITVFLLMRYQENMIGSFIYFFLIKIQQYRRATIV